MTEENEPRSPLRGRLPLPGVAAIALYLLLVSATIVAGVVGKHFSPVYLVFAVMFVTSSAGLIAGFRWAWVLSLSAVFMLMSYNFWIFSVQHEAMMVVQGLLNLVFFFYLIRPEVRERMR